MPRRHYFGALCAGLSLLAASCSGHGRAVTKTPPPPTSPPATSTSPPTSTPPVNPAVVHANELGLVPVLMFHQLVAHPQSRYDQTPAQLKAELNQLAADNYVPITASDFVTGNIDVPAGKHPVVLTFDDSTTSQFQTGRGSAALPT